MRFSSVFLLLGTLFLLSSVYSLDFVLPGSLENSKINLYPELSIQVGFLKMESGKQVFVDSVDCEAIACSTLKASGPYYVFDILASSIQSGKVVVNYHLKGDETPFKHELDVVNIADNISALILLPNDAKFFERSEATVIVYNNSDLKVSGKVFSNFPDDVFVPVDFFLDAKSKKEFKTYFFPKVAGYYDLSYYLEVGSTKERKVGSQTVKIERSVKDFLSLPSKSFFVTNPVYYLYSSIIYFISLLA